MAYSSRTAKPLKPMAKPNLTVRAIKGVFSDIKNKRSVDNIITNAKVRTGMLPKSQLETRPQKTGVKPTGIRKMAPAPVLSRPKVKK